MLLMQEGAHMQVKEDVDVRYQVHQEPQVEVTPPDAGHPWQLSDFRGPQLCITQYTLFCLYLIIRLS